MSATAEYLALYGGALIVTPKLLRKNPWSGRLGFPHFGGGFLVTPARPARF